MDKKIIACTGGIGSGKSAVVAAFAALGIPTYDCDSRTKALYRKDKTLAGKIAKLLGRDVLAADGTLDTRAMAAKVFGDRSLLLKLEAIVHPAVAQDFKRWAQRCDSDIVMLESAILLEKPFFDNFADCVIAVSVPESVRIERVMRRDGLSRAQVQQRLAAQWTDAQREAKANLVLTTDDAHAMLPQILELIEQLKQNK